MKQKEVREVGRVSFTFPITRQEAEAVLKKPKSKAAKALKKYMMDILISACNKMLQ